MTDRELLELAAKAWGCEHVVDNGQRSLARRDDILAGRWFGWNPLEDDGDALRLAVALQLHVSCAAYSTVSGSGVMVGVKDADPGAATRRAIVRAAAKIARSGDGSPGSESSEPDETKDAAVDEWAEFERTGSPKQNLPVSSIGLGAEGEQ